jgi:RHS repeat-associated protein
MNLTVDADQEQQLNAMWCALRAALASSTGSGAKNATTTDFVFNGDSLLATVDQQTASGSATGTARTRFVHPDHLGSTDVVTDENDNLVQTLSSYPYGATRVNNATSTNELRKYVGQFYDDATNLQYLNARYYSPTQGQFLSEDPIFLGDPNQQNLSDPQSLNSYSYSEDNPIVKSDPNGKCIEDACVGETIAAVSLIDLAVEYGPAIVGGIGGGLNEVVPVV